MTAPTIVPTTSPITTVDTAARPVWRAGLVAGVAAAAATSTLAAVGNAAGVSLDIAGEPIPVAGFAQLTLFFTVVGIALAKAISRWGSHPRRTFVRVTVALTALSIVPDLMVEAATATRALLVATHLVAAAIVIPTVARRLRD